MTWDCTGLIFKSARQLYNYLFVSIDVIDGGKTGRKRGNNTSNETGLNADSIFLSFTMFSRSGQTLFPSGVAALSRWF